MQIFGSWSADGREYFERVESEHYNGLMPRSTLYKNSLRRVLTNVHLHVKETPYRELDTEYREMITEDDSLTVDQQLELIIKNHMGYIRNMEIGDLAMQNATELTREQAEELFYDFYGEDTFTTSPFTFYVGNPVDEVRSFERVFRYDDNIFISYDHELVDEDTGQEFVEQIVSSFEILKHRLPLIYDDVIAPSDDRYLRVRLIEDSRPYVAVSSGINEYIHINFLPGSLNSFDSYDESATNERLLSTLLHELIHNNINAGQMHNFLHANQQFHSVIDAYKDDGEMSELLTYSSGVFLNETINMSYSGGAHIDIGTWYGYVDNTDFSDAWVGKDPMDYYVRIIDNRLGQ